MTPIHRDLRKPSLKNELVARFVFCRKFQGLGFSIWKKLSILAIYCYRQKYSNDVLNFLFLFFFLLVKERSNYAGNPKTRSEPKIIMVFQLKRKILIQEKFASEDWK